MTRGQRNIAWIERHCRIPEGDRVGQPVRLTKHQKRWILRIYDSPTRTFILSMGRGNAKTSFAAFLLLLHLCGPEARPNSQLYSDAQSRDQAALLFGYASKCVRLSQTLVAVVVIRDTAKQLACPELGTLYRALSADASTAYGLSPAFVVHDELGQVRGPRSELYEALETAQSKQPEPLSIIISTQAPHDADLLSTLIDDALTIPVDTLKLELYSAPKEADPFSSKAIRAANPHFDEFMNRDEVRRQANEAKRLPSREAAYRNLILNQRVETVNPFISAVVWKANGSQSPEMEGEIYGGLDLSAVSDLTACVWTRPGEMWPVWPQFWLPEKGLVEKARLDRNPYDLWVRQGFLATTPGASIEYEFVATYLRGIFDHCTVKAVAFDRYNMKFLKPWLVQVGFSDEELARFVEFGQGFVSMSPALRALEALLVESRMAHGGHPVLQMCAANAVIVADAAGNRKFHKARATGRIDGMVALAEAVAVASQPGAETRVFDGELVSV